MTKKRETNKMGAKQEIIIYSEVKCKLHELGLTKNLPGRDALKEVLVFLKTNQPEQMNDEYYCLALKAALKKVRNRRFVNEKEQVSVVKNQDDVVQIIRESLRAAGIKNISVKDFIYSLL